MYTLMEHAFSPSLPWLSDYFGQLCMLLAVLKQLGTCLLLSLLLM